MAYVSVDIDLADISDDELCEELESRGYRIEDSLNKQEVTLYRPEKYVLDEIVSLARTYVPDYVKRREIEDLVDELR